MVMGVVRRRRRRRHGDGHRGGMERAAAVARRRRRGWYGEGGGGGTETRTERAVAAARRLVAQFPPLALFEREWAGTRTPAILEWHTAAAPIVRRRTAAPLACLVHRKRRGKGKLRLEVEVLHPVEQMPSTSNLAEDRPRSGPAVTGPGKR